MSSIYFLDRPCVLTHSASPVHDRLIAVDSFFLFVFFVVPFSFVCVCVSLAFGDGFDETCVPFQCLGDVDVQPHSRSIPYYYLFVGFVMAAHGPAHRHTPSPQTPFGPTAHNTRRCSEATGDVTIASLLAEIGDGVWRQW